MAGDMPVIGGSGDDDDGDDGGGGDPVPTDLMGIVKDTVGPMLGGLIGQNLKPMLRGADVALEGVFRLVSAAYEEDAERTQEIITSDARAIEKVSRLNDLLLDGDGGGDGADG